MTGFVRRPGITLAVVALAITLVLAWQTALLVAFPELGRSLGASGSDLQWILDVYPVVLACLLVPAGALGDRYGHKRVLRIGLVVFVAATIGVAVSHSVGVVIALRAVTAIGAALVFPSTLAAITTSFPPAQRARGVAVWTTAAVLGGFGGVLYAGVVLEFSSWRAIAWTTAVVGAVLLIGTGIGMPADLRDPGVSLDPVGAVIATIGVGAVVYGIVESPTYGLGSARILVSLIGGLVVSAGFVGWERRCPRPLLDVRALTGPRVGIGLLGVTGQFVVAFGTLYPLVQYLQLIRGDSPLKTGAVLMLFGVLLVPTAALGPWLRSRASRGTLISLGFVALAVAVQLMALLKVGSPFGLYTLCALVFGLGIGLAQGPLTESIIEALPSHAQGMASALNDVTRELGAALGLAITGAVITAATDDATLAGLDHGLHQAFITIGIIALLTAGVVLLLDDKVRRSPTPSLESAETR